MTRDDGGAALDEPGAATPEAHGSRFGAVRAKLTVDGHLDPRIGWALVALLTLAVLVTWAPSLMAGLGDNHEGRILGRHVLHVSNAYDKGIAGSNWLSDASPYLNSYAHHPPLLNFGYFLSSALLPGGDDLAMRIFAYLFGVAMIPVGAALLRRLGFGFAPVLLSAAAIAVTPLFWNYGRLHANVTLLLAMALVAVRLREDRDISTRELAIGAIVSAAAVVAGYLGLAAGALLGLWVFARRRLDRVTVILGIGLVIGAAITFAYVLGNSGVADITDQVEMRTGGDFTREQFTERMARWREELLPTWWRQVLLPIAVLAGLMDRRTRALVAIVAVVAVAYIYLLPQGSYVHDYWIFPLLLPVWFGTAALTATVTEHAPAWVATGLIGAAAVALGFAGATLVTGEVPETYFREPEEAGTFVRELGAPDGQTAAWALTGVPTPRWLSYYWDLSYEHVDDAAVDEVPDDELVLVRLDRIPEWVEDPDGLVEAAVDGDGGYVLVTGSDLRDATDAP